MLNTEKGAFTNLYSSSVLTTFPALRLERPRPTQYPIHNEVAINARYGNAGMKVSRLLERKRGDLQSVLSGMLPKAGHTFSRHSALLRVRNMPLHVTNDMVSYSEHGIYHNAKNSCLDMPDLSKISIP